ncbi:molybdopterin synthase catalytic subunit [Spinacia oleracea]|uniref:Molybdopterin synthase catalytic subunit n=1 Tax=Spinacia oleracea TaxID=3562 RepID=A0A9R0I650_SPIOL|nr:molybdopterin synthase catalytic subunit-like [Spinacia oleracea]XP_056698926.1 molybdopterin synthase catalytic subunit-like [Spinacia oleracea]
MSEEDKTLIEILEENNPIDIIKYINFVRAPKCGAIATFSGTTRDTFDGKAVVELRYEAYVPMAIRCIKSICTSARETWNLNLIAVAHCLGPVPVGGTSVFIATSSVHRVDALDACQYLIDELKATVPIWKKEVYANGEVWKENSEFLERRTEIGENFQPGPFNSSRPRASPKPGPLNRSSEKKGCCGNKVRVDEERSNKKNDDNTGIHQ